MMQQQKDHALGGFLKDKLKDKSLSMRKFSQLTGTDTAVISKIVNGKRKANINHLVVFSKHLNVPLSTLLTLAGYKNHDNQVTYDTNLEESAQHIQSLLESFGVKDINFSMDRVEQTIHNYYEDCNKDTNHKTIRDEFKNKTQHVGHVGKITNQLHHFYDIFINKKGTTKQLLLIGSALLYFINTIDIIPDYLFSVGFLDDVLVVQYITHLLSIKD